MPQPEKENLQQVLGALQSGQPLPDGCRELWRKLIFVVCDTQIDLFPGFTDFYGVRKRTSYSLWFFFSRFLIDHRTTALQRCFKERSLVWWFLLVLVILCVYFRASISVPEGWKTADWCFWLNWPKRVKCCFDGLFVTVQKSSKRRWNHFRFEEFSTWATADFANFGFLNFMELVRPWQEPICGMQIVLQELGKDAQHCSDTSLLAAWLCMSFASMYHQEMCISLSMSLWPKLKQGEVPQVFFQSWFELITSWCNCSSDALRFLRFLFATFWFCVFHHVFLTATLGTSRNCPTSRHDRFGGRVRMLGWQVHLWNGVVTCSIVECGVHFQCWLNGVEWQWSDDQIYLSIMQTLADI